MTDRTSHTDRIRTLLLWTLSINQLYIEVLTCQAVCANKSWGSSKVLRHSSFGHLYFLIVTLSISKSFIFSMSPVCFLSSSLSTYLLGEVFEYSDSSLDKVLSWKENYRFYPKWCFWAYSWSWVLFYVLPWFDWVISEISKLESELSVGSCLIPLIIGYLTTSLMSNF